MNKNIFEGNWKEMKGALKEQWGKLTDDDLETWQGKTEQLIGKLEQRYGYTKDEAERKVDEFMKKFQDTSSSKA